MESWPNDIAFTDDYEQKESRELTVKGDIPAYVAGILYRTGPIGYKVQTDKGKIWEAGHWFDGLSGVFRFQIDASSDGGPVKVSYKSRRIVDELVQNIRKTGNGNAVSFGAKRDPCKSLFQKVMTSFVGARTAPNIGVTLSVNLPGLSPVNSSSEKPAANGHSTPIQTIHTKTDNSAFCKINPETLEPEGIAYQTDLHPDLKGPMSASHAKADPETGDIFNFNAEFGSSCTYRVFRTSASTGQTSILATFPGRPCYIHSLFLTESYVVLCVWNSHVTSKGLSILYHKNIVDAIADFDASKPATWYVVDRRGGKGLVATYESSAFFCFHTVNAWEEPSATEPGKTDIVTELEIYDNLDVIKAFYYENLLSSKAKGPKSESCVGYLSRFRLPSIDSPGTTSPQKPGTAEQVFKADRYISGELPTINPSYLTKPHRYTYGLCDRLKSSFLDGIIKFDSKTQTALLWDEEGHTPGEAIFVADPQGTEEDDGVLLSVVLDGYKETSYLLVLDARDLRELGRAEAERPISFGFHGAHVPARRRYVADI